MPKKRNIKPWEFYLLCENGVETRIKCFGSESTLNGLAKQGTKSTPKTRNTTCVDKVSIEGRRNWKKIVGLKTAFFKAILART